MSAAFAAGAAPKAVIPTLRAALAMGLMRLAVLLNVAWLAGLAWLLLSLVLE